MKNLFCAELRRFTGSLLLWVSAAVSLLSGLMTGLLSCREPFAGTYVFSSEYVTIGLGIPLFLLLAAVVSVIGHEHSDGALRLKIIAGCRKSEIACAMLMLALLASLMLGVLFLGGFWFTAHRAIDRLPADRLAQIFLTLLGTFLLTGAGTALFSLLIRRQAVAALAVIGCVIGLSLGAMAADAQLINPEYETYETYLYPEKNAESENPGDNSGENSDEDSDGMRPEITVVVYRVTRCDFYVKPPKRWVLLCLNKLNPAEHTIRAVNLLEWSGIDKTLAEMKVRLDALDNEIAERLQRAESAGDGEEARQERRMLELEKVRAHDEYSSFLNDRLEAENEVSYAPQCMLAFLIAVSAVCIAVFRRKDIT